MPPEMIPGHCPYCGEELGERHQEGRERLYCVECDRIIWRNAEPVAAVVVKKVDRVLLVKRGIKPGKGKWSLPAGFLEYEEAAEEAAVRELEEETDLSAEEEDLEFLDTMNIERFPDQRLLAVVFLLDAEDVGGEISPGSDAEDARFWRLEDFDDSGEELRSQFMPAIEKVEGL